MTNHRLLNLICRECQGIVSTLPFVVLAVICAVTLGPIFISGASPGFQSPLSPVSPIKSPAEDTHIQLVTPEKVLPPNLRTAQPEVSPSSSPTPTATATVIVEVTQEAPQQIPAPVISRDTEAEPTTPPTLWVVIGLLMVGGVVAALIVFKKK
jgi:hypothetical protein